MQILFFILAILAFARGESYPSPSEAFERTLVLRENYYRVLWNVDRDAKTITFEIQVKTHGWLGFGISNNGNMQGSDIVMAWAKNDGSYHLTDRFATGKFLPPVDEHQDWNYIQHSVEGNWTIFKFSRKWDTCDAKDIVIVDQSTSRLVYAWNDNNPEGTGGIPSQHTSTNRGTASAGLTNVIHEPELPADTVVYNYTMPNYSLPSKRTAYRCQTFLLPNLTDVHHIVKFGPIVQPGHEMLIHHLSFSYCDPSIPASVAGQWWECDNPVKPANVSAEAFGGCFGTIWGWAIGAGDFHLPADVGMAFGGQGSHVPKVAMMEMHYDNADGASDLIDSSGVSIYATKQLRPIEGGLLDVLLNTGDHQVVPPKAQRFHQYGFCGYECLNSEMDKENVTEFNIYATFLHSHLLGRGMRARMFKNGEEIDPIVVDPSYDFDFQESRHLPREIKVHKNDDIVVECEYESMDRVNVTYGGFGTHDEMCQVLLYVYPKFTSLGGYHCASQPRTLELARFAGAQDVASNGTVEAPPEHRGKHWTELMNAVSWDDQKRAQFQDLYLNHSMTLFCAALDNHLPPMEPNRRFEINLPGEPEVCVRPTPSAPAPSEAAGFHQMSALLLFITSLRLLLK